jgi:hypothetical protein
MAAALIFSGSASAGTEVGNSCGANSTVLDGMIVSLKNPTGYPLPSAIPSSGVITSWTFNIGLTLALPVEAQLKVLEPTGVPNELKVAGESAFSPVTTGLNTTPTRIPVHSGDLLGSTVVVNNEGVTERGDYLCETNDPGDEIAEIPEISEIPGIGTTVSPTKTQVGFQNPVTVTVEPDADGDGYGDETQDKCPTDAATQGPCPTPPPPPAPVVPIALSASAATKKGLVTVTLTSSAQATVTVGGSVKLAKGKSVKLSGGTQIVAPGTLAKFTILFPAKLKAALKQTPSSKKISLSLSASAPGATTSNLTVKVPGQQKPVRKHHHTA